MRDAGDQTEFRTALVGLPTLKNVLEDLSVRHVIVGPNGRWSYEKLGRTRNDQPLLDLENLSKLSDIVRLRGLNRFGEWSVKTYRGKNGDLLLFERLPIPVADRLPQTILSGLKKQVRLDGDGVVIGPTGAGKSSLLCWLALQIPDEDVLLVSENPPNQLPGQHVQHVFPPTSELKRRGFERLIRLSTIVFWDRVSSGQDMATLLASTRAKRRWFTLDSSDFYDALNMLMAWSRTGISPKLNTVFSVSRSGIGRTEPTTFLTFDGDTWMEKHRADQEYANAMTQFDEGVMRTAERLSAPQRVIRQELTVQMEEYIDDDVASGDRTGMISVDSLNVLRDAAVRSQEMDGVSEVTKHYIESPSNEFSLRHPSGSVSMGSASVADGNSTPLPNNNYEKVARASGEFDAIPAAVGTNSADDTGEENLENLRITRSEIITESDLFHISSSDLESLSDDFSSVVEAGELEDISELLVEDDSTNPERSVLQNAGDDETRLQRISGEMTGPHLSPREDDFGMTEELTFGEKLEMLRKRRHDS